MGFRTSFLECRGVAGDMFGKTSLSTIHSSQIIAQEGGVQAGHLAWNNSRLNPAKKDRPVGCTPFVLH